MTAPTQPSKRERMFIKCCLYVYYVHYSTVLQDGAAGEAQPLVWNLKPQMSGQPWVSRRPWFDNVNHRSSFYSRFRCDTNEQIQIRQDRKMLIHSAVFLFVKYAAHLSAFLTKRVLKGAKFGLFCFFKSSKTEQFWHHTSLLSFLSVVMDSC